MKSSPSSGAGSRARRRGEPASAARVTLPAVRPERRFTWRAYTAAALAAFALGYLVCRVADWLVVSDEERIAALIRSLAARARDRRFDRLLDDVRLDELGLVVRGWGDERRYGAGDADKLLEEIRRHAGELDCASLRAEVGEDEVRVDGARARAEVMLFFREAGQDWRQPVRVFFQRRADRWYLTRFEVVGPDELFRL